MKSNALFALLVLLLASVAHGPLRADGLPSVRPEKVGVSSERLSRISELAQRYVDEGKYAGIVTMVSRHGKLVHAEARGKYGLDNDKPMDMDTLFRIFSMTKPVTAVAAMMLYEEGKFQLTDPVSKFLSEFENQKLQNGNELVEPKSPMTMRQLLTHTAGMTYGWTSDNPVDIHYQEAKLFESRDLDEFVAKLAKIPLRFEPGTRYHYSVSYDVLGAVVEHLSGQSLDAFFRARIFKPLGMTETFFSVPQDKRHRLATLHTWNTEEKRLMVLLPEHDRSHGDVTLYSGGGGLVSTITDYMRFCEMLRNGGSFNGSRLLGPKTIQFMTSNHLTPEVRAEGVGEYPSDDLYAGQSMGLGFGVITNPAIMPAVSSMGEYSWGGAAGTKFWIDPEEGIIGIAMVQLLRSPWPLRFDLKVATYQALTDLNRH